MKLNIKDWMLIYKLLETKREAIESNWKWSEEYYKDDEGNNTYKRDEMDVQEHDEIVRILNKLEKVDF